MHKNCWVAPSYKGPLPVAVWLDAERLADARYPGRKIGTRVGA